MLAAPETQRFLAAVRAGKAVHTYIVEGEEGFPGSVMARVAACALNCTAVDLGRRPCFSCSSCRRFLNGTHEDLHVLATTKKLIPVDDVRGLIAELLSSANSARCKIAIIEQAEKMNENGQNCLLTTLEEPHGNTAFFLVTENAEALLPTVRSRARILHAPRLEDETIRGLIRDGFPDAAEERVEAAVALADGAVLTAERFLSDETYAARVDTAARFLKLTEKSGTVGEAFALLNEHKSEASELLELCARLLYAERKKENEDPHSERTGRQIRNVAAFLSAADDLTRYANFNLTIDKLLITIYS